MRVKENVSHPILDRLAHARHEAKIASQRVKDISLEARQEGYSLREVAKVAGVSDVTISNWERKFGSSRGN